MKLSYAIGGNIASLLQAQSEFQTSVVYVSTCINSVLSSRLPLPNQNSPSWNEFLTACTISSGGVLRWVDQILTTLLTIPPPVQNYAGLVRSLLEDSQSQAANLVEYPANASSIKRLNNNLNALLRQINLMTSFLNARLQEVRRSGAVLPSLARQLQAVATKSTKETSCNRRQIALFMKQLHQLQSDLDRHTAAIVSVGIGNAAPLTMGEISVAESPSGTARWLTLGPVLAVSNTNIGLNTEKIRTGKEAINQTLNEMDQLTGSVAAMNVLSELFTNLAIQCAQLEQNLETLLTAWETIGSDISFAAQGIQFALEDPYKTGIDFNALLQDMTGALTEWVNTTNQAGIFALNLQVNNAALRCAMSQEEISEALKQGKTFDAITYFNSVGALAKVA